MGREFQKPYMHTLMVLIKLSNLTGSGSCQNFFTNEGITKHFQFCHRGVFSWLIRFHLNVFSAGTQMTLGGGLVIIWHPSAGKQWKHFWMSFFHPTVYIGQHKHLHIQHPWKFKVNTTVFYFGYYSIRHSVSQQTSWLVKFCIVTGANICGVNPNDLNFPLEQLFWLKNSVSFTLLFSFLMEKSRLLNAYFLTAQNKMLKGTVQSRVSTCICKYMYYIYQ